MCVRDVNICTVFLLLELSNWNKCSSVSTVTVLQAGR